MQANLWLMLRCLLWGEFQWRPQEDLFHDEPGCRKCRPRFRLVSTLLEMSAAKQVQKNKHIIIQESSVFWLEQVGEAVPSKKPGFRSYNSPVDTHSIILSRYCFSLMQRYHILIGERRRTRWTRSSTDHLVSILHAAASLKAVLPFDYVDTSGQKLCTLRAHFTHPYWALDTLPNPYY